MQQIVKNMGKRKTHCCSAFSRTLSGIWLVLVVAFGTSALASDQLPSADANTQLSASEDDGDLHDETGAEQANEPEGERASAISNAPRLELTPQILYQFLLAEIAAHRGQLDLAAKTTAELAQTTRDPRIARRAAEFAVYGKQLEIALPSAQLWVELEPESMLARQTLANVLAGTNRLEELGALLSKDIAKDKAGVGPALARLSRTLSRHPDKVALMKFVDQLTAPYEEVPEAHIARAQAAVGVNETLKAIVAVERALALRPDWELAALMKAHLLERSPAQTAFLKQFVANNPAAHDVRQTYARALVAEKSYAQARAEFRVLLEALPNNVEVTYALGILALQLEDVTDAEKNLRRVLEIGKGDQNPVNYYLGQIAEESKRTDEALNFYSSVNRGEHQFSAALRSAQLLARAGRNEEARMKLAKARTISPAEEPRLLIAEAQLLRDDNRYADALTLLSTGLIGNPDHPELLYESAIAAEKLDRLDVAEKHFRKLIALQPDQSLGYNALGYTFADRNIRLDEAQVLIDKALELSPGDPFILDSKGWLLFRQAKHEQALGVLRQAYAQRQDAEIAAHLGEVLWALGRADEARELWREAVKAHPSNSLLAATIKRLAP
jgi:tetratricopeptide (TPR) repeat protein